MTFLKAAILAAMSGVLLAGSVHAAEVKAIGILTPEEGTDYGWNQQGVDGARAAGEATGVKVIVADPVADPLGHVDLRPAMQALASGGADLLIAHVLGASTSAAQVAAEMKLPVAVVESPDPIKPGLVADYQLTGQAGAYLAGRLAAKMTRSKKVAIVVAAEPPQWNLQSAGFAQGVKEENPDVAIHYAVIGANNYSDAAGGKRAVTEAIGRGADIIFGQGNAATFGMLQAVETTKAADGGKALLIDVTGDKIPLDMGFLLSSVVWNFTPLYVAMIEDLKKGSFGTRQYALSLKDDSIQLLKTKQIPGLVWRQVAKIRKDILAGKIKVNAVSDATAVRAMMTEISLPQE